MNNREKTIRAFVKFVEGQFDDAWDGMTEFRLEDLWGVFLGERIACHATARKMHFGEVFDAVRGRIEE